MCTTTDTVYLQNTLQQCTFTATQFHPQANPLPQGQLHLSPSEEVNMVTHALVNLDPAAGAGFLHARWAKTKQNLK